MQAQVINQRIRQGFERLLLECLTSGAQKELLDQFEVYAGYLLRWRSVAPMSTGEQTSCALAASYLSAIAVGVMPMDRAARVRLGQLSKCLGRWGMGSVNAPEFSATEHELLQAIFVMLANIGQRVGEVVAGQAGHGNKEMVFKIHWTIIMLSVDACAVF